jgi:hypothetical protein
MAIENLKRYKSGRDQIPGELIQSGGGTMQYYAHIQIFNKLPASTAALVKDKKHFVLALKRFLIAESSYSINEYLNYQHQIIELGNPMKLLRLLKMCLNATYSKVWI